MGIRREIAEEFANHLAHHRSTMTVTKTPAGLQYTVEPSGIAVSPRIARAAMRWGFIVPREDGLWEGDTQTWEAAPRK